MVSSKDAPEINNRYAKGNGLLRGGSSINNMMNGDAEKSVLTLADDGEKFGMWPGTYDWVYERKWLDKFFTALSDNQDWIETTTFSSVLDSAPPSGKVYLPAASYMEMGGWSLPAGAGEKFNKLQARLEREGRMDMAKACFRFLPDRAMLDLEG